MSVLLDCRFAATHSGLGRFTRELVTALLRRDDVVDYRLLVTQAPQDWLPAGHGHALVPTAIRHYSIAEHIRLPRIIAQSGATLLFSPHFNVPWTCPVPFVATVHDLILHRYPNEASWVKRIAYRRLLRRTVLRSRRLCTVSAFVRDELVRCYGAGLAATIALLHEGVGPVFAPRPTDAVQETLRRHGVLRPFFLYVGNAKEHKNVQTLIDAFAQSGVRDADLLLVTAGPETSRLRLAEGVRIIAPVEDSDLASLYAGARAFVTASLYEGCCLPVLEARHCGCPVIASNSTAIPEVAGEGAMLLPPDRDAFAAAFASPPPRTGAPAHRWEWDRTASEVADVLLQTYRELTDRSSPRRISATTATRPMTD